MSVFDRLMQSATRQQMRLLGGVTASYYRGQVLLAQDITVVVHRDVDTVVDQGRAIAKKTQIDVFRSDVPSAKINDKIVDSAGNEYVVAEPLSDDGHLITVLVR